MFTEPTSDAQAYLRVFVIMTILILASLFVVTNPTPWSPLGQASHSQPLDRPADDEVNLEDFDIPDGWGPAYEPVAPSTSTSV